MKPRVRWSAHLRAVQQTLASGRAVTTKLPILTVVQRIPSGPNGIQRIPAESPANDAASLASCNLAHPDGGIACSMTRSRSAPEAPEASCAAIYYRVKTVAGCGEMLLWRRRDAEQQTGLRRNARGIPKRQGSRRQSERQRFLGDGYVRCAVRQSQHHC